MAFLKKSSTRTHTARVNGKRKTSPKAPAANSRTSRLTTSRRKATYRKLSKYSAKDLFGKKGTKKGGKTILQKILMFGLAAGGAVAVIGVIVVFAVLSKYTAELPNPAEPFEKFQAQSTKIFDRNGELLYTIYGDENREVVSIDNVSPYMKWAILSAEDIDFLDRKTFIDIPAFVRAVYYEVSGTGSSGFSGITQQMIQNTVLSRERSYERKVKEVILTMQVESRYTKEEILQLYLNEIPFGGNVYGIKSAANSYFGKEPSELTLAESALLAGLPQSPSYYSPIFGGNPEAAKARQEWILDQMLKHNDKTGVTAEEVEAAKAEELIYSQAKVDIKAPHFVFYIKQVLETDFGYTTKEIEQGGLQIYTSLDYTMQQYAEEELKNKNQHMLDRGAHNGAIVSVNPKTGEILAMAGSKDYWGSEDTGKFDGNVNVATALRQPGSSVKPYTYVTGFDKGVLFPTSILPDVEIKFGDYEAKNWDGKYYGPMTAKSALQLSRNIPAIKALDLIGIDAFIETAEKFGITTFKDRANYGLSLTLGAADVTLLEHTAAYGVFATGGIKHPTTAVIKITKSDGTVDFEYKPDEGTRVFDEQPIYLLNTVIGKDNCGVDSVHQKQCVGDYDTAGKTGTSNENRNLWYIGYTPDLVTGVWAGNNDNTITSYSSYGSTVALPIWHDYMARVLPMTAGNKFSRPSGIVQKEVCKQTGRMASDLCPEKVTGYFIDGKFPPAEDMFQLVEVCKDQQLLATDADKLAGNVEEKVFLRYKELKDSWQPFLDAWMDSPDREGKYSIPTAYCEGYRNPGGTEVPWTVFDAPVHNSTVSVGDVTITMRPISPYTITKLEVFFDDKLIKKITSVPYEFEYTIPADTTSGTHKISATAYDANGKNGTSYINIIVDNPTLPTENVLITSVVSPSVVAKYTGDTKTVDKVSFFYEVNGVNTLIGQGSSTGVKGEYSIDWDDTAVLRPYKVFVVVKFKDVFKDDLQSPKVTVAATETPVEGE